MEFAEFGYKGASIMNIAKRANLPRANVHYYFNSKLELYKKSPVWYFKTMERRL